MVICHHTIFYSIAATSHNTFAATTNAAEKLVGETLVEIGTGSDEL